MTFCCMKLQTHLLKIKRQGEQKKLWNIIIEKNALKVHFKFIFFWFIEQFSRGYMCLNFESTKV